MKKTYAVIGYPVSHSISPAIHQQALNALEIDASYVPFEITCANQAAAFSGLKALGIDGFNITAPYKEAIIPYLDELADSAKLAQAVNTVKKTDTGYVGYNTDGYGFIASLKEDFKALTLETRFLIIGAGGAAKGILEAMKAQGYNNITITNRTLATAENLAELLNCQSMDLETAQANLADFDCIVQTTSVGMDASSEALPIELTGLRADTFVSDLIYNPQETAFLKAAGSNPKQNGLGMLIYQAALAFEIWTGKWPDIDLMYNAANEKGFKKC